MKLPDGVSKDMVIASLFILPALTIVFITGIIPLLFTLGYSFLDYYMLQPQNKEFIGLQNYVNVFKDEIAMQSLKNTFYFVFFVVPLQTSMGLILALLVNKSWKEMVFYKAAFFSPTIMSLAVISVLWITILNPTQGIANRMLAVLGIGIQPFLSSPQQALNSIIGVSAWHGCGSQMLIFLAGLQNIPTQQYEAAAIDGANKWQQFFHITIPNLRHTFYFVFITITIQAFKLIVQPMIMTNGGPLNSTKTALFYIFETGFRFRNVGYASAMGILFMLLIVVVSIIQQRYSASMNKE
ncbi:MAG: carbohydrate ABC transporter permease [Brevinema sp.]